MGIFDEQPEKTVSDISLPTLHGLQEEVPGLLFLSGPRAGRCAHLARGRELRRRGGARDGSIRLCFSTTSLRRPTLRWRPDTGTTTILAILVFHLMGSYDLLYACQ